MKRSYFKKRGGKLRKQSPQKISVLQRKVWEHCKRIIRKTHGNTCYTCRQTGLAGSNWQTGHMWAKASLGAFMKYDLRVLRPQCLTCNYHQGGRGADFYLRMWQENGADYMNQLQKDRQVTVKAYDHYQQLLNEYENL